MRGGGHDLQKYLLFTLTPTVRLSSRPKPSPVPATSSGSSTRERGCLVFLAGILCSASHRITHYQLTKKPILLPRGYYTTKWMQQDLRKQIFDQLGADVRTTSCYQEYHKMLELVKGHAPAKTIDNGVLILMEQTCWRLSILGEKILIKIFDTALSFMSKWALTLSYLCAV